MCLLRRLLKLLNVNLVGVSFKNTLIFYKLKHILKSELKQSSIIFFKNEQSFKIFQANCNNCNFKLVIWFVSETCPFNFNFFKASLINYQ